MLTKAKKRPWLSCHLVKCHLVLTYEEVYITQSKGFEVKSEEHKVFRLFKALYGLCQALQAWYEHIDSFLIAHNFKRGDSDMNLDIHTKGSEVVILALYVNDILPTGSSIPLIHSTKSLLETTFEMSKIRDGTGALYLQAECTNGTLSQHQCLNGRAWF